MSTDAPATGNAERPRDTERLARLMRGSLASLRAAAETLARFPEMPAEQRRRLHRVVAEESARLAKLVDRLERLAGGANRGERRRTTAGELLTRLRDALSRPGLEPAAAESEEATLGLELDLDHEAIAAAFGGVAAALRKEFAVVRCRLGGEEIDRHLLLDWAWRPDPADAPRLQDWQGEALEQGQDAPSLRQTARDHGGEAWFDLDRHPEPEGRRAHFRILLPLAGDEERVQRPNRSEDQTGLKTNRSEDQTGLKTEPS